MTHALFSWRIHVLYPYRCLSNYFMFYFDNGDKQSFVVHFCDKLHKTVLFFFLEIRVLSITFIVTNQCNITTNHESTKLNN